MTQSERHTVTSQVLNQLIRDGIVAPAKRPEAYRRLRAILNFRVKILGGAMTPEALRRDVDTIIRQRTLPPVESLEETVKRVEQLEGSPA